MTEKLSTEATELIVLPIEEQISQELVKANVTEAVIASLRERFMGLKIADINDKETYLIVKEGRKECKSIRVIASKICKKLREDAVAIQKASVAKEKYVTGSIAEIEDALQEQEDWYESEVAKEKEARKRKQEEQLIVRQQTLTNMGALYSDGNFTLGEVSFELSLIKESENDIWEETILPKFKEEYEKVQAEYIEQQRKEQEKADELKRQQEELEQRQKELEEKESELKKEAERQADEYRKAREKRELARTEQLLTLGLKFDFVDHFKGYGCFVSMLDLRFHDDGKWDELIKEVTAQVAREKEAEAEKERKEQERKELQNKRYAEMYPYKEFGSSVQIETLWCLSEDEYSSILLAKKSAYEHAEEEKKQKIADDAAKKERERIEEEQRQAEAKRITALGEMRMGILKKYNADGHATIDELGSLNDITWEVARKSAQDIFDESTRKQEEERKAEELARAGEKVKWASIIEQLSAIEIPKFQSGQYNRKVAILREKLEEIKAL